MRLAQVQPSFGRSWLVKEAERAVHFVQDKILLWVVYFHW